MAPHVGAEERVPGVSPRPAATVCALRPGAGGPEILMVRRSAGSAFFGNAYVFPGGGVDSVDHSDLAARAVSCSDPEVLPWKAAAVRELAEEVSLWLTDGTPGTALPGPGEVKGEDVYRTVLDAGLRFAGDDLAYLSNWVTPRGAPRRFNARFFVVAIDRNGRASYDGTEVTDAAWVTAEAALRRGDSGEWLVRFPTRKHLELLCRFSRPEEAVAYARRLSDITPITPRSRFVDGKVEWLVPGEDGYEDLPG